MARTLERRRRAAVRGARDSDGGSGIGRQTTPGAEQLSLYLRTGSDPELVRRRRVVGLSLVSMAAMGAVTLYQTGLVRHLPDPPTRLFDSDSVDASGEAYAFLAVPDAPLAAVSYAVTATLAAMGGPNRAERMPWLVLLLAGKGAVDVLGAAWLTAEQASQHRRFCSYCLLATLATGAAAHQMLGETRRAGRVVLQRRRHTAHWQRIQDYWQRKAT